MGSSLVWPTVTLNTPGRFCRTEPVFLLAMRSSCYLDGCCSVSFTLGETVPVSRSSQAPQIGMVTVPQGRIRAAAPPQLPHLLHFNRRRRAAAALFGIPSPLLWSPRAG